MHVDDDKVKKVMLQGLETRFKEYDQPAMLIAYMLNPQRQTAFLNPVCNFVTTRKAVQLVEILYLRFFPKEAEAEAQAKGEAGIADQFIAYMNKETQFDESKYTALLPYLFNFCNVCVCVCARRTAWHLLDLSQSCQQSAYHVRISKNIMLPAATMCNKICMMQVGLLMVMSAMCASCDKSDSLLLHAATMRLVSKPGTQPERLWNLVRNEATQLSKLALRLMGVSVNAAGCERSFSQMGLTHTKLQNRLGWAKTTHIAQLRQDLHRDRPTRKRARVVTAVDSAKPAAAEKSTPAADSLMDLETLTSASEFRLTVNEWIANIEAEEMQAAGFNLAAYMDSPAVVKAPLRSIFGSALMPLLDDDTMDAY